MNERETIPATLPPLDIPPPGSATGTTPLRLLDRARQLAHQPRRAVLKLVLVLLVIAAAIAAGVWIWYEIHLRAARTDLDRGHNADAIRHLRACQSVNPHGRDVMLLSARAARCAGAWEEADNLLTTYWERDGDEEPLVLERLLHRAARGDLESAGASLRARIAQGGPDARLAREALASGFLFRFRWPEAAAVLEAWLAENPDDTLALILSGKFLEQQQGYEDALKMYRRILELDAGHVEARLRIATILVSRRRGDEAAAELVILKQKLPDHPEVQVLWARSLAMLGRTDESRQAIDDCLRANPDYPAALLERGTLALVEGDEAAAEAALSRAVKLDPGNLQLRNQYALVLRRLGKNDAAAVEHAIARQLEADSERIGQIIRGPLQERPNDPALHHEIGAIALRSGLITEALRWFTSALQVDPDHQPTHRVLATLYHEARQAGPCRQAPRPRATPRRPVQKAVIG